MEQSYTMETIHATYILIVLLSLVLIYVLVPELLYLRKEEALSQSVAFLEDQGNLAKYSADRSCFEQGRQTVNLSGYWKSRKSRGKSEFYYTNTCEDEKMTKFAFCKKKHPNCPWIMGHYWCGTKRNQNLENLRYQTDNCELPLLEPYKFLNNIGPGNTLWYIGDSMTSEMYISTLCVLREFALPEFQRGEVIPNPVAKSNKLRVSASSCVKFVQQIRICFIKSRKAVELSDILRKLHGKFWNPNDYVVMNYGLHPNSTAQVDIKNALSGHEYKFHNHLGQKMLLWRETSAQHFKNPGGVYTPDKLNMPCTPLNKEDYLISNEKNLAIRGLLEDLDVPVLETWAISSERYDAHSSGECSHLCIPGVPDEWVRLLHVYMNSRGT